MSEDFSPRTPSTDTALRLIALGAGAALFAYGATRRSTAGKFIAVVSVPLVYRGAAGRWPSAEWAFKPDGDTRRALGGDRGVYVREAIRLELPISEVYKFWRRFDNLPRLMRHLDSVREDGRRSHWVAIGPADVRVEWDAELINDETNKVIAWRSLPGSDITTAGSVNFDRVGGGTATQVTVTLQYAPPAGKPGAAFAALFGREPSQMIRQDLRRMKQLMESGDFAQSGPSNRGERG
jgi:uncharacterized membrane protein